MPDWFEAKLVAMMVLLAVDVDKMKMKMIQHRWVFRGEKKYFKVKEFKE